MGGRLRAGSTPVLGRLNEETVGNQKQEQRTSSAADSAGDFAMPDDTTDPSRHRLRGSVRHATLDVVETVGDIRCNLMTPDYSAAPDDSAISSAAPDASAEPDDSAATDDSATPGDSDTPGDSKDSAAPAGLLTYRLLSA